MWPIVGFYFEKCIYVYNVWMSVLFGSSPSFKQICLNSKDTCHQRTIIKTLISGAELISSSRTIFFNELRNIKQILIYNGCPNYTVDKIKDSIHKTEQHNIDSTLSHKKPINLHYQNQFNNNYKIDEHVLEKTYPKNVLPTDPNKKKKKTRLIIYYNNFKISNLIISNNSSPYVCCSYRYDSFNTSYNAP